MATRKRPSVSHDGQGDNNNNNNGNDVSNFKATGNKFAAGKLNVNSRAAIIQQSNQQSFYQESQKLKQKDKNKYLKNMHLIKPEPEISETINDALMLEDSFLEIKKLSQNIQDNNNVMEQIAYDDENLGGVSRQTDQDDESIQVLRQQQ